MKNDKFYGLIGRTLGHSWSLPIHHALGCPSYRLIELEPDALPGFLKREDIGGLNVTMPYKKTVMPFCDWIDPEAAAIGSVNTLVRGDKPIMGKPFYLAPELAQGAEESAASDWYSLGVMMLRMLTQVWYSPGAQLADLLTPFDPQWRKVLPSLLAADPAARSCPPWRVASPVRVVTTENRTNEVTLRIRFPHWLLGGIVLAVCVACLSLALLAVYEHGQRRSVERELDQMRRQMQGGGD